LNAAETGAPRRMEMGSKGICAWRAISVAMKRQMMGEG
jgi:hypothetical protein